MRRDPAALTAETFDLLVVGAGVYGACAAWDAALRGLRVALVDRADFGAATSANSQKLIHGGLRYLQKAQLRRMRESIRERRTFLRIAPRLVRPVACVVPAYGHGLHGPEALRLALALNDALSWDRNAGTGPRPAGDRPAPPEGIVTPGVVPRGRTLTREELRRRFPTLPLNGVTGGAVWTDALMRSSERLTLAFAISAAQAGAVTASYVEVRRPIVRRSARDDARIVGVEARDLLAQRELEIRARVVLNAAGPWSGELARGAGGAYPPDEFRLGRGFNAVVDRPLLSEDALGLPTEAGEGLLSGGGRLVRRLAGGRRFFFLTPWRNRTVVGTRYLPDDGGAGPPRATSEEVAELLARVDAAWPAAALRLEDVTAVQCGRLPLRPGADEIADDHRLYDAAAWGGPAGLLTVRGVKYTTARAAAEQAVDLACALLRRGGACATAVTPLRGATAAPIPEELPDPPQPPHGTFHLPEEQIVHAVRHEAAVRLADLVLRRTDLAAAGPPAPGALEAAAARMGRELGWDPAREDREMEEARAEAAAGWQPAAEGTSGRG